ncbi:MAG: hypothetical protein K2W94_02970 [Alphaproteobacteria bacterium]|nr:hypothetical protein [Alphaproteobacteria bacterium]
MRKNLNLLFAVIMPAILATKSYALDNLLSSTSGGVVNASNVQSAAKGATTDLAVEEVKSLEGDLLTSKGRSQTKSSVSEEDIEDAKHKADKIQAASEAKGKKEEKALEEKNLQL